LLKDKRPEAWCIQISKIVDSITGFWTICRPVDAEKLQDDNIEQVYSKYVFYQFLGPKKQITLSNSTKMMEMLFALLKMTLNQGKNEPYFLYGHLKAFELLQCFEGILSQSQVRSKKSTTAYLGLNVSEFNNLLTKCKINALQVLRQMVMSFNLLDHVSWLRRCLEKTLNSEEIMQSENLLKETFRLFGDCINTFKFGFGRPAVNLLVKSDFIIHPNLLYHIMTILKIILLREDTTIVKMGGKTRLKAGLKVDENMRDLAPEFEKFSTKVLEERLHLYLSFLNRCVDSGVIKLMKKGDRALLESRLYTILQLSHFKFSPLKTHLKVVILEITIGVVNTHSFVTHNRFVLSALLNFVKMAQQEEIEKELKVKLEQATKIVNIYAGMAYILTCFRQGQATY
jgi:hypothetical protein